MLVLRWISRVWLSNRCLQNTWFGRDARVGVYRPKAVSDQCNGDQQDQPDAEDGGHPRACGFGHVVIWNAGVRRMAVIVTAVVLDSPWVLV
jgi:hypothetical protein